jgi:dTDP-4-amino-4,6-dideoxygalactose transaminase
VAAAVLRGAALAGRRAAPGRQRARCSTRRADTDSADRQASGTLWSPALRAEGIGVTLHYVPAYWHPYYQRLGYPRGLCPIAEEATARLFSLPIFPGMSDADVEDVVAALWKALGHYYKR